MKKEISRDFAEYLLEDPQTVRCENDGVNARLQLHCIRDGRVLEVHFSSMYVYKPDGTPVKVREKPRVALAYLYSLMEVYEQRKRALESFFLSFRYSLPQQETFLDSIRELSSLLPDILNLTRESLDYSIESVAIVEQGVRQLGSQRCVEPDIYPSIVAYVCLTIARAFDATIEMTEFVDLNSPLFKGRELPPTDESLSLAPCIKLPGIESEDIANIPVAVLHILWSQPDDPAIGRVVFEGIKDFYQVDDRYFD